MMYISVLSFKRKTWIHNDELFILEFLDVSFSHRIEYFLLNFLDFFFPSLRAQSARSLTILLLNAHYFLHSKSRPKKKQKTYEAVQLDAQLVTMVIFHNATSSQSTTLSVTF